MGASGGFGVRSHAGVGLGSLRDEGDRKSLQEAREVDLLDELANIGQVWAAHRAAGREPKCAKAAFIRVAEEVASLRAGSIGR